MSTMAMKWIICLWTIICLKVTVGASYRYACNGDARQKAMHCIETLFPTAQRSGPMGYALAWDYDRMKAACMDGTISMSVHCVQSVMMSCENNQEQLHILRQYFDTKSMQEALYSLCDQLEEARQYMPCMQSQLHGFTKCAEDKLGVFEERSKIAGGNMDKIVAASCSFMNIVYDCQTTAVRKHCGEFPAKFILNIMNGFRPPSCNASGAEVGRVTLNLIVQLFFLVLFQLLIVTFIL
ncbi:uncharacterized protein LOC135471784 [Liolophura sinensis]|uniref:uncharacterized protein LOC135471784 n=1 Tax=Liolophura sinensis TaxID=3198878 RepID=UPI00315873F8